MFEHQLEQWLKPFKTARQRAVFIFTPPNSTERDHVLAQLTRSLSASLWLSDTSNHCAKIHRYRDYLGLTTEHVVLDFNQLIHADALAALAGTVNGGGCLWIVLPVISSCFQQRLVEQANKYPSIVRIDSWSALLTSISQPAPQFVSMAAPLGLPSSDQQSIIDALYREPARTHVLLADRGRGKSTTLGFALKHAPFKKPMLVTGPRPSALTTLLKEAGPKAVFCAWDRLLRDPSKHGEMIIIDEAAAIPLHCLQQLFSKFRVWAVATTVDGYEGCGQGFVLRFMAWLNQRFAIREHRLEVPLRWAQDDYCEVWLNDALLLNTDTSNNQTSRRTNKITLEFCHASQLNNSDLAQVMSLLLEAHYQSSPNDLRLLLDDPLQHLLLARTAIKIVGVTWLATEGPIAADLQPLVMPGKRRLKGQLLPQAVGFYRQQPACLKWRWWRITRIAVAQTMRRRGIAKQMLDTTINRAQQQAIDAIGTSFGVTQEVLNFWHQTPLHEVRRGLKKNAASGSVSALWAVGLTSPAQQHIQVLATLQRLEQAWSNGLRIDCTDQPEVMQSCGAILRGFSQGALPFSNARFAWWLLATQHEKVDAQLTELLQPQTSMAALVEQYRAASRAGLEQQLRAAATKFLINYEN